jgi:hypothetical protein
MRSSRRTRNENHQVSDFAKKVVVDGSLIQVQETHTAFHRRARRNVYRHRGVHQQSGIQGGDPAQTPTGFAEVVSDEFPNNNAHDAQDGPRSNCRRNVTKASKPNVKSRNVDP